MPALFDDKRRVVIPNVMQQFFKERKQNPGF